MPHRIQPSIPEPSRPEAALVRTTVPDRLSDLSLALHIQMMCSEHIRYVRGRGWYCRENTTWLRSELACKPARWWAAYSAMNLQVDTTNLREVNFKVSAQNASKLNSALDLAK